MYIYKSLEYNLLGEIMLKRYNIINRTIFPNKKINIFVIIVLFLGVIAGSIFATIISINDKTLVIDKIKLFIDNINSNSLDSILIFKNSITINYIYVLLIWVLGMTIIGIIINIFLVFLKGFIFSFSIGSFILTYGYKGITLSLLYLIFGQLLNIMVILIIAIYSIMFTMKLLTLIIKNNNLNITRFFKNYGLILLIVIILSAISALSEAFILPALVKLIIKLFV